MKRYYCEIFNNYHTKDTWLESKCCESPNDSCRFHCWKRPAIPCLNCEFESKCINYNTNNSN